MSETRKKILLAEDDISLGELLKNYLEMHDFDVTWYKNGIAAFKGFNKNMFDIWIHSVYTIK